MPRESVKQSPTSRFPRENSLNTSITNRHYKYLTHHRAPNTVSISTYRAWKSPNASGIREKITNITHHGRISNARGKSHTIQKSQYVRCHLPRRVPSKPNSHSIKTIIRYCSSSIKSMFYTAHCPQSNSSTFNQIRRAFKQRHQRLHQLPFSHANSA